MEGIDLNKFKKTIVGAMVAGSTIAFCTIVSACEKQIADTSRNTHLKDNHKNKMQSDHRKISDKETAQILAKVDNLEKYLFYQNDQGTYEDVKGQRGSESDYYIDLKNEVKKLPNGSAKEKHKVLLKKLDKEYNTSEYHSTTLGKYSWLNDGIINKQFKTIGPSKAKFDVLDARTAVNIGVIQSMEELHEKISGLPVHTSGTIQKIKDYNNSKLIFLRVLEKGRPDFEANRKDMIIEVNNDLDTDKNNHGAELFVGEKVNLFGWVDGLQNGKLKIQTHSISTSNS